MNTPWPSILYFVLASLLGAIGQVLYKTGADATPGSWWGYALEPRILGGAACYVGVMALFLAAFRRGGSLAVLYPIYATTFIWAALIAAVWFGHALRPTHFAGMGLLLAGMYCMGR